MRKYNSALSIKVTSHFKDWQFLKLIAFLSVRICGNLGCGDATEQYWKHGVSLLYSSKDRTFC
jgi:hypothetical protein